MKPLVLISVAWLYFPAEVQWKKQHHAKDRSREEFQSEGEAKGEGAGVITDGNVKKGLLTFCHL